MIITRLSQHEDLKAIHTIIRSKHSGLPDTAADSNEDVVASIISCSAQQKSRPVIRGKPHRQQFQRQQSLPRSPIMKKTTQRISAAVWERCLKKQEINFVKKIKRANADSVVVAEVAAVEAAQSKCNGESQTKQRKKST